MALFTENLVPFGGAELLQIELESQFLISSKMQKACGACLRAPSSSMRKRPKYQLYQYWPSVSTNSFGIQLWLYTFCMIVHILHSVSEYSLFPGDSIVYKCVPISTSIVFLPFCHFIQCISISPLHLLVSRRTAEDLEVKGVLSSFIHCCRTFLCSAPSNCLLTQKMMIWTCLEQKKAESLFERTHEESNTCLDPKVNWDNCR